MSSLPRISVDLQGLYTYCPCNGTCYCANYPLEQQLETHINSDDLLSDQPIGSSSTTNHATQQDVFNAQQDTVNKGTASSDDIYNFIHDVKMLSQPRLSTGNANQEPTSPLSVSQPDRLSPNEQRSGNTQGRRRRPRASSGSSRTSNDPNCRFAPDFVSISDSQRSSDSSLPPVLLRGSQKDYEDVMEILRDHVKREDIDSEQHDYEAIPGLGAMVRSANYMYRKAGCFPFTREGINAITSSPEYLYLAHDIIAGDEYMQRLTHGPLFLGHFALGDTYNDNALGQNSEVALAAILKVYDGLCGTSHRLGVIEETGELFKAMPIYNLVVLRDSRDLSTAPQEYKTVWIFRSKAGNGPTHPCRWSSLSSCSSSQSEVFCEFDCWRTFPHVKALLNHQRQTHMEEEFRCPIPGCGEVIRGKRGLARHQKTVHGNTAGFRCDDCNKIFNRKDNLQRHKRSKNGQCAREA